MSIKTYKIFLMLAVLAILGFVLPAKAAGWALENSGVTSPLNDIDMVDYYNGLAVGGAGVIRKTADGGKTWSTSPSGVQTDLLKVFMLNQNTAWAVGYGGTIIKTTNGGTSWSAQTSGVTADLRSVAFWGSQIGYVVGSGGTILVTANGGSTWVSKSSGTQNTLFGVAITPDSSSHVWVVGDGKVLTSGNGGASWVSQSLNITPLPTLRAIGALSSTNVFAVGSPAAVLQSTDSGNNWNSVSIGGSVPTNLMSLSSSPAGNTVFFVGENRVYKTTDGGASWTFDIISTPSVSLRGVDQINGIMGWVVDDSGKILKYDPLPPTSPSALTKTTADNDNTPTFTWSASTDDIFYIVDTIPGTWIIKYEYAVDGGSYVNNGLNLTATLGTLTNGTHIIQVRAIDAAGNVGDYAYLAFTINATTDTTPPTGSVSINAGAATTNSTSVTLNLSCTDNISCALMQITVDGVAGSWGIYSVNPSATLSSGDGTKTVAVKFKDGAGNISAQYTDTIILSTAVADTTSPAVGAVTPTTATIGVSNTYSTSYSDTVGVTSCNFYLDGANLGAMVLGNAQSGTAQKTLTFSAAGSHQAYASCKDAALNTGTSPSVTTIVVSAAATPNTTPAPVDTTAPFVSSITPTTAVTTYAQSFTISYSDAIGVVACDLYVNSANQGPMTLAGTTAGTASRTYSFSNTTSHNLQARCSDAAGNIGLGALTTVSVSAAPAAPVDTTAPSTPPGLQKVSNDADATPTFIWNATSDNIGATNYLIQIDNSSLFDNGGSTSYTIPSNLANGSHTFKVLAKDAAGNSSPTSSFSFTVNAGPAAVSCPLLMEKAYKFPTSKAVFYITTDCAKRPFKNGPSFFTYFDSWSEVITTTQTILNSIANDPLGFTPAGPKYDPKYGALVKIVTDPKVYLLLGTEKYWIISEPVFTGLKYDWKWIEDIDPGLLNKYSIGSEITYTDHHPNYTIIKYAGFANTYRLEPDPDDYSKQVKRWIKNEKVFNALKFRWDRIVTVPNSEVYKDGKVMDESEVNL